MVRSILINNPILTCFSKDTYVLKHTVPSGKKWTENVEGGFGQGDFKAEQLENIVAVV